MQKRSIVPIVYILFLMLPIYWLVAMSFKTTNEILSGFSLFPQTFTLENYVTIFTDPKLVLGLHQLDPLCVDQHGDLYRRGPARRLCLLALSVPR